MHTLPFPARWDDIRVLLAVLREGSFSGAATTLQVEQSTVSRRIAALETALGGALFDRTATGPRATELALRLQGQAERMESELASLLDLSAAMHEDIQGRVRVALTSSLAVQVVVPSLLTELKRLYPKLCVDLVVDERAADLAQREADIALRFFKPTTGDVVVKRIASLRLSVLATASYMEKRALDAKQLDWIVLDLPGAVTDADFVKTHVQVEPTLRTNSHLVQIEAVRAGLGVASLTRALRALYPNLIELKLDLPERPPVELWLVAPRSLVQVPRVRAVWDFMEKHLSALETVTTP